MLENDLNALINDAALLPSRRFKLVFFIKNLFIYLLLINQFPVFVYGFICLTYARLTYLLLVFIIRCLLIHEKKNRISKMVVDAEASVLRVFLFLVLLFIPSTANSSNGHHHHDGDTHPAASIDPSGGSSSDPPSTPGSPEKTHGEAGDPALKGASSSRVPQSTRTNTSIGIESFRPKRTPVGKIRHHPPHHPDSENLVSNLKNQLKESQAAQVHTR